MLTRVFTSPDERRLRAGWRLLLQSLLLLLFVGILSTLIFIPLGLLPSLAGVPAPEDPPKWVLLALSIVVALPAITASVWIARRALDRRTFRSLGLEIEDRTLRDLLVGVVIPAPLFALAYVVHWGLGWLEFEGWGWSQGGVDLTLAGVLAALIGFFAVGFYEELLFRGYYLYNLRDGSNLVIALFVSSALFAFAHVGNFSASLASTLGIFAAGYFLAYGWLRTRALWLPIGLHIGWNFFQGPVFGFAVSGTPTPSIFVNTIEGPELLTGGDFGPEAGLFVLPMMLLGGGLIWLYTRGREGVRPRPRAS